MKNNIEKVFCENCAFYGQDRPEMTYKRNCTNKVCFEKVVTPERIEVLRTKDIADINANNDCIYFIDKEKVRKMSSY